mmetsp:Transcript_34788/g.78630  ORF Transcript_34788/g.78630 Transcript_34788/m.78630 type:complete len:245 (-) Transcript_34788:306-1040(-)
MGDGPCVGAGGLGPSPRGNELDLPLLGLPPHLHPGPHREAQPLEVWVELPERFVDPPAQLNVGGSGVPGGRLAELHRVKEAGHVLLPLEALVLLHEVGEGVGGLVVLDVRVARFGPETQMIRHHFGRPARPHVVVARPRLTGAHKPLHERRADELAVEGHVHGAQRVEHPLGHRHRRVHVPLVPLINLEELRGGVVVVVVEPEAVRDRRRHPGPQRVRVAAHKVRTVSKGVVHRVEEVRGARAE